MTLKRKAMIMAAGKGTRLLPLTKSLPKALVEYHGKTLLQNVLEKLRQYHFNDVIINLHHFPDMIREFLENNNNFGMNISFSDESEILLETGGGLKKASWFFDSGPFLVHNVDIESDINLDDLYKTHLKNPALATLAVKDRETTRPLLMDNNHVLCGWKNLRTREEIIVRPSDSLKPLGFSCVYILDPKIFNLINETGNFSITPVFLKLAKDYRINMYLHSGKWKDMGKIERYR